MKYKVTRKQNNSKMCAVCGVDNPFGIHGRFYDTDTGEVIGLFRAKEHHQSFPERVHGGIISAMLDEVMSRALNVEFPEEWSVTVDLRIRFKKPVPLETDLKALGRITRMNRKIFETTGEIYLPDGTVAAEGWGKFFRGTPGELEGLEDSEAYLEGWQVMDSPEDPTEIEI